MEPTIQKAPGLTGIFVPRAILEDQRLSLLEKVLFGLLDGFARGERGCFASNGYLARCLGRSNRCVRLALANLEAAGLVRRIGSENRRTIATVSALAIASNQGEGGRKKIAGGGGRKLPTDIKERLKDPPNPPKGGRRKFLKIKLTAADYGNGF